MNYDAQQQGVEHDKTERYKTRQLDSELSI